MEQSKPALLEIDDTASSKLVLLKKNLSLLSSGSTEFSHEEFAHYVAIKNYLKKPKAKLNASALEQVSRYLEIIHHLCRLQDWESIKSVFHVPVNIDTLAKPITLPLYEYLCFNGLANPLLEATQEIIEFFKTEVRDISTIYILKAKALHLAGEFDGALSILEELQCSSGTLEAQVEVNSLLGIYKIRAGIYKEGLTRVVMALNGMEKVLNYNSNLKMLALKTDILSILAFHEMNSTRFNEALHLYSEALKIVEENNMDTKIVNLLAHKGIIFRRRCTPSLYAVSYVPSRCLQSIARLFNFHIVSPKNSLSMIIQEDSKTAAYYLMKAKLKAEELGDNNSIPFIHHHLSWVLFNQGDILEAEKYCNLALEEYEKREFRVQLADCYQQLGRLYLAKGNQHISLAKQNFEKALIIRRECGNKGGVPSSLLDVSIIYFLEKKYLKTVFLFINSIFKYWKTGTMNFTKFIRTITFFWIWTVGKRDWTL